MNRVAITKGATGAPYSPAIVCGDFVFTAGQLGLVEGKLAEGFENEVRQAMENLKGVLEAAGTSMDRVVKTTLYVLDMGQFGTVNGIYKSYFPSEPPARTTVAVAALPFGGHFEIDAVALAK
jgi:2-iminobutanoate/2-iminopropanoate deaminase